jgi:hypothetical protein
MPAIVTASQLRSILGVSVSLYSDAQLDSFIDSAEQTILPLLTQYQSSVTFANVSDSVIYFTTIRPNYFVPGQSVIVTGAGTYNGTYTVTDDRIEPYTFTAATAAADRTYPLPFIPSALATLSGSSAAQLYASHRQLKMQFWLYRLRFSEHHSSRQSNHVRHIPAINHLF